MVECAFALPFTFFLLLALVVGSMGVFRYHVATRPAKGARYGLCTATSIARTPNWRPARRRIGEPTFTTTRSCPGW